MSEVDQVYIHIGLPKAASSYLQQAVFPAYGVRLSRDMTLARRLQEDDFLPQDFARFIQAGLAQADGQGLVVSHESLSGRAGGGSSIDVSLNARRLSEIYPGAKILLVTREQLDYTISMYAYFVKRRLMTQSIDRYLRGQSNALAQRLQFHTVYEEYAKYFSEITVIPYELLKADHATFIAAITTFLGRSPSQEVKNTQVNVSSRNIRALLVFRTLNKMYLIARAMTGNGSTRLKTYLKDKHGELYRFAQGSKCCYGGGELSLPDSWVEEISPIVRNSNKRLSELSGVDLKRWGYL